MGLVQDRRKVEDNLGIKINMHTNRQHATIKYLNIDEEQVVEANSLSHLLDHIDWLLDGDLVSMNLCQT